MQQGLLHIHSHHQPLYPSQPAARHLLQRPHHLPRPAHYTKQQQQQRRHSSTRPAALLPGVDVVVTPQWLAQHLEEVTVLDVRGRVDTQLVGPGEERSQYVADYDAYLEGHIPGAVFINWLVDGVDPEQAAPVQLQMDPDLFGAALEAKGVTHEKAVVVYDAGDGMFAARYWWMLTTQGHPQVLVLQQGWAGWTAAGLPNQLYEPCTLKVYSYFEAQPQPQYRVSAEQLLSELERRPYSSSSNASGSNLAANGSDQHSSGSEHSGDWLLLDTRSLEQYNGTLRRGPRAGRIPGAVPLPRSALMDPSTGWWRPLEEQREILEKAGVKFTPGQQQKVVLYCNGGVAACTVALALQRLGCKDWAVYDGSWNEWGSREDLPIELPKL